MFYDSAVELSGKWWLLGSTELNRIKNVVSNSDMLQEFHQTNTKKTNVKLSPGIYLFIGTHFVVIANIWCQSRVSSVKMKSIFSQGINM